MKENSEPHVGQHVIYHHNKRNENLDALVLVIFSVNGAKPPLSLITIRPGERGPAIKVSVPHRDDATESTVGYWTYPEEMNA